MTEQSLVLTSAYAVPVFRRYLATQGIAMFGKALSLVAMPLLAYRLTGSAALTALVASAAFWPYLVFGLLAGALADRVNRRKVMVGAALISSPVLASVPLASLAGLLTYPQLLLAELTVASVMVFSDAAAFGVLPQLVGRGGLPSATSALMILGNVTRLVGPAVAGVLVALVDPALIIGIDAVGYLVVAVSIWRLRWSGGDTPERRAGTSVTRDIGDGLRFIWQATMLRWLTIFGFGASLALGGVAGLLVVIGVEQVGLADTAPQIGWLYVASASGTLLGTGLLPLLQRWFRIGRITAVGLLLALLLLLALSTVHELVPVLVLVAVFQIPLMALILNAMVARSVITPDAFQSRVNTTGRMIAGGGSPFGAVITGIVAEAAGTEWALRVAGIGLLISLIGVLVVGVHRYPHLRQLRVAEVRREPVEDPAEGDQGVSPAGSAEAASGACPGPPAH